MSDFADQLGLLDDEDIQLDLAAVQLSCIDGADQRIAECAAFLSAMEESLLECVAGVETPSEQAEILAAVLAGEYGFTGDVDTFDDPANLNMVDVLKRRRGIPVSLGILYVAMARRLGWWADALDMPGHLLVRIGDGSCGVIVDPFAAGSVVNEKRYGELRVAGAKRGIRVADAGRVILTNRDILARLLFNDAIRAEDRGDTEQATAILNRIARFAPLHLDTYWQQARLAFVAKDWRRTRRTLVAMLEPTRDAAERARIAKMLARDGQDRAPSDP